MEANHVGALRNPASNAATSCFQHLHSVPRIWGEADFQAQVAPVAPQKDAESDQITIERHDGMGIFVN